VNLTWATALFVSFGVLYIFAYGAKYWCYGRGLISDESAWLRVADVAFTPVDSYVAHDLPGSRGLEVCSMWCAMRGNGENASWSDADPWIREIEESRRRLEEMGIDHSERPAPTTPPTPTQITGSDFTNSGIGGGLHDFKPSTQPDSDLVP
jgi:hypothetical protein